MTRPDLDAIRAKWKQRNVVSGNDVPTLLRHIDALEHMLAEERENVDALRAAVEHAEQRFVDESDARKAAGREIAELKARIVTLEAMR
jgi:flagellar biosynthesis chaperone FliJ